MMQSSPRVNGSETRTWLQLPNQKNLPKRFPSSLPPPYPPPPTPPLTELYPPPDTPPPSPPPGSPPPPQFSISVVCANDPENDKDNFITIGQGQHATHIHQARFFEVNERDESGNPFPSPKIIFPWLSDEK